MPVFNTVDEVPTGVPPTKSRLLLAVVVEPLFVYAVCAYKVVLFDKLCS